VLGKLKIPMILSRIKPVTIQLLAQCLDQLHYHVPPSGKEQECQIRPEIRDGHHQVLFFKFRLKPFKITFAAHLRENNFVKCIFSLVMFAIFPSLQLLLFKKSGGGGGGL
jgi:hypothetical protein